MITIEITKGQICCICKYKRETNTSRLPV